MRPGRRTARWALAALGTLVVFLAVYRLAPTDQSGTPVRSTGTQASPSAIPAGHGKQPPGPADSDDESGCLSPEQMEMLPELYDDSLRYLSVSITGETMGRYRGLSQTYLESLATQGDSGAMAVLGAMAELEAFGESPDRAVGMLTLEDVPFYQQYPTQPPEESVRAHLQRAADWYYAAALNGRVMGLYKVGEMRGYIAGGAVGLGWISKEALDELPLRERSAMLPSNVYQRLSFVIAPTLADGPTGEIVAGLGFKSPLHQLILETLHQEFEADRIAAGLPPIAILPSGARSLEELVGLVCESYLPEDRQGDAQ